MLPVVVPAELGFKCEVVRKVIGKRAQSTIVREGRNVPRRIRAKERIPEKQVGFGSILRVHSEAHKVTATVSMLSVFFISIFSFYSLGSMSPACRDSSLLTPLPSLMSFSGRRVFFFTGPVISNQ
jgi:hypothetical protein